MPEDTPSSDSLQAAMAAEAAAWADRVKSIPPPSYEPTIQSPVIQQLPQEVAGAPIKDLLLLPFKLMKWGPDKIRCVFSRMNENAIPDFTDAGATGFNAGDNPPCIFTPTTTGKLYAHVEFDATNGLEIVTELKVAASVPADDVVNVYREIGSWTYASGKVLNIQTVRYGPLDLHRMPPNPPNTGDYVLTSQNGDFIWEAITAC